MPAGGFVPKGWLSGYCQDPPAPRGLESCSDQGGWSLEQPGEANDRASVTCMRTELSNDLLVTDTWYPPQEMADHQWAESPNFSAAKCILAEILLFQPPPPGVTRA